MIRLFHPNNLEKMKYFTICGVAWDDGEDVNMGKGQYNVRRNHNFYYIFVIYNVSKQK